MAEKNFPFPESGNGKSSLDFGLQDQAPPPVVGVLPMRLGFLVPLFVRDPGQPGELGHLELPQDPPAEHVVDVRFPVDDSRPHVGLPRVMNKQSQ